MSTMRSISTTCQQGMTEVKDRRDHRAGVHASATSQGMPAKSALALVAEFTSATQSPERQRTSFMILASFSSAFSFACTYLQRHCQVSTQALHSSM